MRVNSLDSLSITLVEWEYKQAGNLIMLAALHLNPRRLFWKNCHPVTNYLFPPVNCQLKCLTIDECDHRRHPAILEQLPGLQTLVIAECIEMFEQLICHLFRH